MKPTGPCKGCEMRTAGCHGRCEKYQAFRKALEEWRAKVRSEQPLHVIKRPMSKCEYERLYSDGKLRK